MKTKEEIIEGLKTCTDIVFICHECPYYGEGECGEKLMRDALELIETLLGRKRAMPETWKESVMQSFVKVE